MNRPKRKPLIHWMVVGGTLLAASTLAFAQNIPPPVGAILDLNGTTIFSSPELYTVSFTAGVTNTAISFALRDDPAYLSLSNVSVVDTTTSSGNLLLNGAFTGTTYTDGSGNTNVPTSWIFTNPNGAPDQGMVSSSNCQGGGSCWYDGSVQAYDELSQTIGTKVGDTYQITFSVGESSGFTTFSALSTNGNVTGTGGNGIDVLTYAQAGIPVLGPVPEPSAYALMLAGLGLVGVLARRRKAKPR